MKTICILALIAATAVTGLSQESPLLADRGTGVATSMFGTYVRRGDLLIYPFFEHYKDANLEYAPEEFGYPGDVDFRGSYRANEQLLFVAYGVTDNLAVEFEAATIQASFHKSPLDLSGTPSSIEESGLGDVEGEVRWRWRPETASRPELFSYGELVIPHHKDKVLIGTPGVEVKLGTGMIRAFRWGTVMVRGALEYDQASSSKLDIGEFAVEYIKRLSPRWRVVGAVEGTADELSLIAEAQWRVQPNVYIKFNNGFALSSKATDWAPEIGIVFELPTARSR